MKRILVGGLASLMGAQVYAAMDADIGVWSSAGWENLMADTGSSGLVLNPDESSGDLSVYEWTGDSRRIGGDGGFLVTDLRVEMDRDPYINYALGVTDDGAPSSFMFTFGQEIAPVSGQSTVFSSWSATLHEGDGGGVTLTAVAPPTAVQTDSDGAIEIQVATLSDSGSTGALTNMGVDIAAGPYSVAPGWPNTATFSENSGAPVAGPQSASGWNYMRIDVNFSLSGGDDVASMTGRADIIPSQTGGNLVPVPPAFWLMASALVVGLGFVRRRSSA